MTTNLSNKKPNPNVANVERLEGGDTYKPRVDIWESSDELVLLADMPGVAVEDLDIQYENRELRIHGKVTPRQERHQLVYAEYGVGDFYRTFTVGESIHAEKISAELKNGVLTLRLPKTEAVKPRRIDVRAN